MRTILVTLLLSLPLLVVSPLAHAAPIDYTVNRTVGQAGVVGSIETDGTLGVLVPSNVLDWNLTLKIPGPLDGDPVHLTTLLGPLSGPNSNVSFGSGSGISFTASPSDLLFDFSNAASDLVKFSNGSGRIFWCMDGNLIGGCSPGDGVSNLEEVLNLDNTAGLPGGTLGSFVAQRGPVSVAVATTPEPGTILLLGTSLAAFGVIRRRFLHERRNY